MTWATPGSSLNRAGLTLALVPDSIPPPSASEGPADDDGAPKAPDRVITLALYQRDAPAPWRKRLGGGRREADRLIRLAGSEIVFEHPGTLQEPLTVPAGLVAVAAVDPGATKGVGPEGRFAILERLSPTAVVPQSEAARGWLWTTDSGSALPLLGDGPPNLALVFVAPLEDGVVERAFQPDFLVEWAQRSPLGAPTVSGLLARVTDVTAAENAFAELGISGTLTDREVAPAQRRHLASDLRADPAAAPAEDRRRDSSIPPPAPGRGDRR